jgi:hypothetical protein
MASLEGPGIQTPGIEKLFNGRKKSSVSHGTISSILDDVGDPSVATIVDELSWFTTSRESSWTSVALIEGSQLVS